MSNQKSSLLIKRTKHVSRTNYDHLSRWYDLLTFNSEEHLAKLAIQQLKIQPGETVLEIGCGTGANLERMAQKITPCGNLFGLDISSGMLSRAARKAIRSPSGKTIHLIQGDGGCLPIACHSINAILLSFTLELFDTAGMASVIAECRRVQSPTGRICVVGLSRKPGNTFPVRIYDWFHARFPTWIDCQPIFIEQTLTAGGYNILSAASLYLFGLPVEIVIANVISNPS